MNSMRFAKDKRGISQMMATLLLIGFTIAAGVVVYAIFTMMAKPYSSTVDVLVINSDIVVAGETSIVSVTIKNTGTVKIDNARVTVYGETGNVILDYSDISTGETSSNTITAATGTFEPGTNYAATIVVNEGGTNSISKLWTITARS